MPVVHTENISANELAIRSLEAQLRGTEMGPMRHALRESGLIYLGDMRTRFIQLSQGGGEWPPLAQSTIRWRLSRRIASTLILTITKSILDTLTPVWGGPNGQLARDIENGVEVGISGGGKHPMAKVSIGQLAYIQHTGNRYIPSRKILVNVPPETRAKIVAKLQEGLNQSLRG